MSAEILHGDCLTVLPTLLEKSVQTCVTSPPYWGLRDYGVDGQLGLEKTPDEYVAKMVDVFREVRRVLRDDGTLWLNLGDSYAAGSMTGKVGSNSSITGGRRNVESTSLPPRQAPPGLKTKDLVGIPWRVTFALQSDGWYLRSDIIWHKPNPMPESVTDRPTKAHEYLFLLTKAANYYYDADAIHEPTSQPLGLRRETGQHRTKLTGNHSGTLGSNQGPSTRNRRSVWTVATRPYKGAHFATFPPALIEPCILAGSAAQACEHCGAAWVRVVEKTRTFESGSGRAGNLPTGKNGAALQGGGETLDIRRGPCVHTTTTGFAPSCDCPDNNGTARSVVLDPFGGSGTTAVVATRHNRNAISIELNAAYLPLQHERLAKEQPSLGVA